MDHMKAVQKDLAALLRLAEYSVSEFTDPDFKRCEICHHKSLVRDFIIKHTRWCPVPAALKAAESFKKDRHLLGLLGEGPG